MDKLYQSVHSGEMDDVRTFQPKSRTCSRENPTTFKRLKCSWNYVVLNTWSMEIFAISFSILCLAAIFTVLLFFDNNLAPQIKHGLTLNAIVAALAAAAKSSLICAIAGSIGQLKWCWFTSRNRKLQDLQIFDDASRGPLGAINALSSFSCSHLISIASLVTVLAVAFDPSVQQVLTYPVLNIDDGKQNAMARRASIFKVSWLSWGFSEAINSALWNTAASFQRDPICPSGNCTWPTFESLAWCSKCKDITHLAVAAAQKCNIHGFLLGPRNQSLLCDFSFDGGKNMTFANGTNQPPSNDSNIPQRTELNTTVGAVWTLFQHPPLTAADLHSTTNKSFLGIRAPFLALARVELDTTRVIKLKSRIPNLHVKVAEECVLSPCMRKYQITTTGGISSFNVLSEDYGLTTVKNPVDPVRFPEICWQSKPGNFSWVRQGDYGSTNSSYNAFCALGSWSQPVSDLLSGSLWQGQEWGVTGIGHTEATYGEHNQNALLLVAKHNLTYVVGNMAASLTRLTLDHDEQMVIGKTKVPQTYVHVQWAWLVLPVVLEVAGVVLLTLTILKNRRERVPGLWKSSLLPLLYHGLDEHLIDDGIGTDITEMDEKAEGTVVRLATNPKTRRLLLAAT